jgi:hypothetical protein
MFFMRGDGTAPASKKTKIQAESLPLEAGVIKQQIPS